MASKRPLPYDEPPSPETDSEDDSETRPKTDSEEEDVPESEPESEEIPDADTPAPKNKPDSESDKSPSPSPTPKVSNYTIKPIVKEKKGNSKAVRTKPEDEVEEKKGMINRIWGPDEEIVVLQGLIDYKRENNKDPSSNYDDFHNSIKDKLTDGKFTKVQVKDKVNRLKRKYRDGLNKTNGKDPEFSNSHDLKCFQLSKRIWGPLETNVNASTANVDVVSSSKNVTVVGIPASNGKVKTGGGKSAKKSKVEKAVEKVARVEDDVMEVDDEKVEKVVKVGKGKGEDLGRLYPHLMKAFEEDGLPKVPIFDEMKHCLNNADSLQLEEWDKKWKKIRLAETDAYISKLALIQEQTTWVLNAMKSSSSK